MAGSLRERLTGLKAWSDSPAGRRARMAVSLAVSAMILFVLARAIAGVPRAQLVSALGAGVLSWGLFAASYAAQPVIDWWMFRRWWRLRLSDLGAFLRRRVLNEAVVSYGGDAWLGLWAAGRLNFDLADEARELTGRGDGRGRGPRGSPLAAIKDAAITSGLAGNLFTLLNLVGVLVLGGGAALAVSIAPDTLRRMAIGFSVLVGLSLLILVNRGRVLSLATRFNLYSFGLHMLRVVLCHVLLLASWAVAVPGIAAATWAMLGAIRLVITRMPVPNKEVLFAALAADLVGRGAGDVGALMAVQGAAWLLCHAVAWGVSLLLQKRTLVATATT